MIRRPPRHIELPNVLPLRCPTSAVAGVAFTSVSHNIPRWRLASAFALPFRCCRLHYGARHYRSWKCAYRQARQRCGGAEGNKGSTRLMDRRGVLRDGVGLTIHLGLVPSLLRSSARDDGFKGPKSELRFDVAAEISACKGINGAGVVKVSAPTCCAVLVDGDGTVPRYSVVYEDDSDDLFVRIWLQCAQHMEL